MLPPPTTRHSSWPLLFASAISLARPAAASGSMPNCPCPIRASPESFRRIRLKRGRVMRSRIPLDIKRADTLLTRPPHFPTALVSGDRLGLRIAGCRCHFRGEVFLLLLDAFAELEADEALQHDTRAGFLRRLGNHLGNRGLVVHDEQLRQQGIVLAELREAAFNHLLDDVLRLAAFLRLFHGDRTFTLD